MELHRAIFNEIRSYRGLEIYARACDLSRDDPRCQASLEAAELKFFLSGQRAINAEHSKHDGYPFGRR